MTLERKVELEKELERVKKEGVGAFFEITEEEFIRLHEYARKRDGKQEA